MKAWIKISDAERDLGLVLKQTAEQASSLFLEQGCLVMENALPRSFVIRLSQAFSAETAELDDEALLAAGLVVGVRRVMVPLLIKPPFDEPQLWANPILSAVLCVCLEAGFVLDACNVVVALPGAPAQALHRDNALPYGYDEVSVKMPPFAITLAIPLIDLSDETGMTELYEGSHRQLLPTTAFSQGQAVRPSLRMGDAYFMDYRLVHGGTANSSAVRRPILYLIYTRPWYIDSHNHLREGVPALLIDPASLQGVPPFMRFLFARASLGQSAGFRQ